jgi:iron complex transport system ATP-binding protein
VTGDLYRLEGVGYSYGAIPALEEIGTHVAAHEIVGLVGPNGAGKSTLLKLLGGLLRGWRGAIHFQGIPLERWKRCEIAKRVAYVPQQAHITFPYTAREVVLMGRLPHQDGSFFETGRDREQVDRALALTDCRHLADRPFGSLSGGERQLVVLASALAQEPQVLLLDEPTVFLDLKHQLAISSILSELHRDHGVTLILVTHDLNMAQAFCSRVLAIKDGRLSAVVTRLAGADALTFGADVIEDVFEVRATSHRSGDRERIVLSWSR